MKRPATATIGVFLAVILVAAAISAVLLLATDGAPAIEVGDQRVSEKAVNQELEAIADARPGQVGIAPGSVGATTSAGVSSDIVRALLSESILDRRGERVTDAERQSVGDLVSPSTFRGYPAFFKERYAERVATIIALSRVLDIDLQATGASAALATAWRREARRLGVTVDPVYGRWVQPLAQVVPATATAAQIRDAIKSQ